ncbi:MAG: hypothetical protein ACFFD6_03920 [Candidatus Thorarchaeota archaeon]
MSMKDERNQSLQRFFHEYLESIGSNGVLGVASYQTVYNELMQQQKEYLDKTVPYEQDHLLRSGSIISIGITYDDKAIDAISKSANGSIDFNLWNVYAREYGRLNETLNELAQAIADEFDGFPITATLQGLTGTVKHVTDYYGLTISHRVVAEHAGLGWRGKNGLIINENYSCALRFASIVTPVHFEPGTRMNSMCDDCTACEDVCSFIKHRDELPNYRENCRRYLVYLQSQGMENEVCGKCIRACYRDSIFSGHFRLE